ncbi:MAG: fasciclin domain-containing protein [Bacteroidetes bacterium]|nr:fasciclin domain-containing protein [Bacteroidota bacterium]
MKRSLIINLLLALAFLPLLFTGSCRKLQYVSATTTDVNIVDYLRRYPDQFSDYVKVLERTNIAPFLNAYGAYTCFAPTNDAFKLYLKQLGKGSVDDVDTATLRKLCQLHLIQDTISTQQFTDGKLFAPTMYGQYLTTGVNEKGVTIVNRQAAITQPNIRTGNGYIHVLDHVLMPATLTIAQTVEQNTNYSFFTQALKETGFYDSLNIVNNPDTTRRWLTFFAESDSVLKADTVHHISSNADLRKTYCNTGNPKNPKDSLYLYVAYHIVPGIKYMADIVSLPSHATVAPLAVITQTLDDQTILLNQATFNGILEKGVAIDRANSDVSCTNGVLHVLKGNIYLKIRTPVRGDFDIAAQPEIIKLTSIYRRVGKSQTFAAGSLADVTWQNTNLSIQYTSEPATTSNYYWFNDHLDFNMRFGNAATNNWIEFTTPLIVKGRYKVWVNFRAASVGQYVQVSFDGTPTPKLIDFVTNMNASLFDAALEATGYKRYAAESPSTNNKQMSMLAGVIDVPTTDRHKIRFTCVKDQGSGAANSTTCDFIQFIPETDNQLRPLFNKDGTIVP